MNQAFKLKIIFFNFLAYFWDSVLLVIEFYRLKPSLYINALKLIFLTQEKIYLILYEKYIAGKKKILCHSQEKIYHFYGFLKENNVRFNCELF